MDAYLQAGLEALGDATRMSIFQRLTSGPMAVHELAGTLPVSRPAVSQHLRVLKEAGLVTDSKNGTRRVYQLNPEGIARLRAHFDLVWDMALSAFQTTVNSEAPEPATQEPAKTGESHDPNSRVRRRPQKRPRSSSH